MHERAELAKRATQTKTFRWVSGMIVWNAHNQGIQIDGASSEDPSIPFVRRRCQFSGELEEALVMEMPLPDLRAPETLGRLLGLLRQHIPDTKMHLQNGQWWVTALGGKCVTPLCDTEAEALVCAMERFDTPELNSASLFAKGLRHGNQ